jgi:hypothetical protein
MEPGFGWVDVVYAGARLFVLASLVYFVYLMGRLWNELEIWSPETLRALLGRERDETSRRLS